MTLIVSVADYLEKANTVSGKQMSWLMRYFQLPAFLIPTIVPENKRCNLPKRYVYRVSQFIVFLILTLMVLWSLYQTAFGRAFIGLFPESIWKYLLSFFDTQNIEESSNAVFYVLFCFSSLISAIVIVVFAASYRLLRPGK
ncbi:hypothetical protein BKI51_02640 [Alphaproteobacteria bacterium AO1-B]|nr:hypothetical protein BKI51_02640 [Alphaproteobacteria bacterium AO1-B]